MEISKETKARIARKAKAHVREVYAHATFEKDSDYDGQTLDSYIAGAEAEATRAAILVDALQGFIDGYDHEEDAHKYNNLNACRVCYAEKILAQYNNSK